MSKEAKISKLEEELLNKIKSSVLNSSGNEWKKEWSMGSKAMPYNAITGRTFSSDKTNLLLIAYTNSLINRNKEQGLEDNVSRRWFPISSVIKNNLWKAPEYKEIVLKDGKTKKVIKPTPIYAWSESPFYGIFYKDPLTDKLKKYSITKGNYKRDIFFLSEIHDALKAVEAKGISKDDISLRMCGNKITPLYHESQLDPEKIKNLDLPERKINENLVKLDDSLFTDIKEAINLHKLCFDDSKSMGRAYYSPQDDEVVLPSKESFKSKDALFATAFHELTHATGSPTRLNRKMANFFGTIDYAKEELVAEIGSIFLCNKFDVNSSQQMQNHGEYLKSWLNSYSKGDKEKQDKEILSAFVKASKASKFIENSLSKYKEKELSNTLNVENDDLSDKSVSLATIEKTNAVDLNPEMDERELEQDSENELELKLGR